jgi:hypothetical protein
MRRETFQNGVVIAVEEVPDAPAPTRALVALQRLTDDIASIDAATAPTTLAQVVNRLSALTGMVRRNHVITRGMLRFMAEQYQQAAEGDE